MVVVTPDRNPPATYAGAQVIGVHGRGSHPGLTLVHFTAQRKPFLTHNTP